MKIHFGVIFTFFGLILLSACGGEAPDRSAAVVTEIMQADRDFAELAERETVSYAFKQYLGEDAVMLPDGGGPLRGQALKDALETMDYNLEWEPQQGWGAASGELGVTWGYWTLRAIDGDGNPVVMHGKYTTVWKKDANGQWKYVLDLGNNGPAPEARE